MAWPALGSGRLLENGGDDVPRRMTVPDRTRLIGRLPRIPLSFMMKPSRTVPPKLPREPHVVTRLRTAPSRISPCQRVARWRGRDLIHDPSGCYLDGTFGRGGHSRAILERLSPQGRLLAIDRDPQAIEEAAAIEDSRFSIERGDFARLGTYAEAHGLHGKLDGILLDVGVSSPQLDDPERGFSFLRDGPLDMRMDPSTARVPRTGLPALPRTRSPGCSRHTARSVSRVAWRGPSWRDGASVPSLAPRISLR